MRGKRGNMKTISRVLAMMACALMTTGCVTSARMESFSATRADNDGLTWAEEKANGEKLVLASLTAARQGEFGQYCAAKGGYQVVAPNPPEVGGSVTIYCGDVATGLRLASQRMPSWLNGTPMGPVSKPTYSRLTTSEPIGVQRVPPVWHGFKDPEVVDAARFNALVDAMGTGEPVLCETWVDLSDVPGSGSTQKTCKW